jgi:AcrR family transcriptional regulator
MASPQKTRSSKTMPHVQRQNGPQKKSTREKILEAATLVFSDYPYHTASIRMIGKAAKIDHPLVNYYFPTKAALFEEVLKISTEKYYVANISWFNGLIALGPTKGLALYIDRFLDFALKHPKTQRIITLNLVPAERSEIIPGYHLIQDFFEKTTHTFTQAIPLKGSKRDIEMLTTSFNTLAINYLGARTYYAGILGMDPSSRQYMEWVKESLIYMILPRLKQLLEGAAQ